MTILDYRNYEVPCKECGTAVHEEQMSGRRYRFVCPNCGNVRHDPLLMMEARRRRTNDYLRLIGKNPDAPVRLKVEIHRGGRVQYGTIALRGGDSLSDARSAVGRNLLSDLPASEDFSIRNWKKVSAAWGVGRKPDAFACEMEGTTLIVTCSRMMPMVCLYGCPRARRNTDLTGLRQIEVIRYE